MKMLAAMFADTACRPTAQPQQTDATRDNLRRKEATAKHNGTRRQNSVRAGRLVYSPTISPLQYPQNDPPYVLDFAPCFCSLVLT